MLVVFHGKASTSTSLEKKKRKKKEKQEPSKPPLENLIAHEDKREKLLSPKHRKSYFLFYITLSKIGCSQDTCRMQQKENLITEESEIDALFF